MSKPLEISVLDDMDHFIKINSLQEVTNPIYMQKNVPTSDGLLSYEIFGTSQADRQTRMAYIDLKNHYMTPLGAKKLRSFDRRMDAILYSREKYTLKNGDLIKDPEGNTGPEFLYSIWGKVKTKEKLTITTKEIEEFFKQPKDSLFITKFPVIPAFYRDINDLGESNKSTSEINSKYSSLISYSQNMDNYSDTFTTMKTATQARVQGILVELYDDFMVKQVKGQPAKYGLLRRFVMSKNIDYSARLVLSAPILSSGDPDSYPIKIKYAGVPLATICSCFYPFMLHHLRKYFDREFIQGGKYPVLVNENGKKVLSTITIKDGFDDEYIEKMINRYIDSSATRFDTIPIPENEEGKTGTIALTGRFLKDNTTLSRPMTVTDILYIVAQDVVKDKHVYITRFPLDNYNGQFPAKIHVTTTLRTMPILIGDVEYKYFPLINLDTDIPENAFIDTLQINNVYLEAMGGDYDGDTVSIKPVFSIEGNKDCEKQFDLPIYYLDSAGRPLKKISKDFILTAYKLTKHLTTLKDINKTKPKYRI